MVAVSSLLLLPSFVAMAYGELVQIEQESFLTSAAILDCVALVEVFCQFLILKGEFHGSVHARCWVNQLI